MTMEIGPEPLNINRLAQERQLITLFYLCQKWGNEGVDLTYVDAVDVYCEVAEQIAQEGEQ